MNRARLVLSGLVTLAGLGFASTAQAQAPASVVARPVAPGAPTYYYYSPAGGYYVATPIYRSPATTATQARSVVRSRMSYDPTGRNSNLHKPWLRPLR